MRQGCGAFKAFGWKIVLQHRVLAKYPCHNFIQSSISAYFAGKSPNLNPTMLPQF
jgi:hypothetical protein